jgi:hypothetical protein
VFALNDYGSFGILQSRIHELWAKFFASSLEDRLRYTPSDCFETFPFPQDYGWNENLARVGQAYYEERAKLMRARNEGLTITYNRMHDPEEQVPGVQQLRELHDTMDRAVLDAYGWTDIQPKCEFTPEFDDQDEEDENGRPRKKKYRYRWPDEIRDEVLARLLELNRQRALEQGQLLAAAEVPEKPRDGGKKKGKAKSAAAATEPLFATEEGDD